MTAKIIKKFGSVKVMNGILFLFSLRLMFYGQLISPWQVILFEWVHGPIVGLFYPIMTSTAFQISPDNLTTTTTAVAYFMEGLGNVKLSFCCTHHYDPLLLQVLPSALGLPVLWCNLLAPRPLLHFWAFSHLSCLSYIILFKISCLINLSDHKKPIHPKKGTLPLMLEKILNSDFGRVIQ